MTWICWWSSYSWTYSLWEFDAFGKLWVRALWWDKTCAGLLSRWLALPWCPVVHVGVYMRILNLLCPGGCVLDQWWYNEHILHILWRNIPVVQNVLVVVGTIESTGGACMFKWMSAFVRIFHIILHDNLYGWEISRHLFTNELHQNHLIFSLFLSNILSHKYCIITQLKSTTTGK